MLWKPLYSHVCLVSHCQLIVVAIGGYSSSSRRISFVWQWPPVTTLGEFETIGVNKASVPLKACQHLLALSLPKIFSFIQKVEDIIMLSRQIIVLALIIRLGSALFYSQVWAHVGLKLFAQAFYSHEIWMSNHYPYQTPRVMPLC